MNKRLLKAMSAVLCFVFVFSLCSCGGGEANSNAGTKTEDGTLVWYLGSELGGTSQDEIEAKFANYTDKIDPAKIYDSANLTAEMIHGTYTLNNLEKDLKTVREDISFNDVELGNSTKSVSVVPVSVYLGADNVGFSRSGFRYGVFNEVTDNEVAVLEFATEDGTEYTICTYELSGDSIKFKQITQTSGAEEPFAYDFTGVEFTYDFELSGPYITLSKGSDSLKLTAYCFTENTDNELTLYGYSLPESALIDELDYFSSGSFGSYAIRADGSYYQDSAYKMDDAGRITVYLADEDAETGEIVEFCEQYAYIIQSSGDDFLTSFSLILLDGSKEYYYTDDVSDREARVLADQGVDVNGLTEEEIEEIAEKKSDLFDDLYKEFTEQGIDVTINRRTGEIAMDASVLFGGDSAEITAEGKELINKFLSVYTTIIYNEKYDGFIAKTVVEGHTAPLANSTYESGLPLSEERANNVKNYCLSAETGVDTAKLATSLEAVGLSNSKPIYGSDGEIDMDACRRVSFTFVVNVEK